MVGKGTLRVKIDERFPLERVADARVLEGRKTTQASPADRRRFSATGFSDASHGRRAPDRVVDACVAHADRNESVLDSRSSPLRSQSGQDDNRAHGTPDARQYADLRRCHRRRWWTVRKCCGTSARVVGATTCCCKPWDARRSPIPFRRAPASCSRKPASSTSSNRWASARWQHRLVGNDEREQFTAGPGYQVDRARLDPLLLDAATKSGVRVLPDARVLRVDRDDVTGQMHVSCVAPIDR